jgi:hypothetical protein
MYSRDSKWWRVRKFSIAVSEVYDEKLYLLQLSFALLWSTLSMDLWQSPMITELEARQPTHALKDINLWVWQ